MNVSTWPLLFLKTAIMEMEEEELEETTGVLKVQEKNEAISGKEKERKIMKEKKRV